MSYPALRWRLWVVRGRLAARAAVGATRLDRRVVVLLAAAAAAMFVLALMSYLDVPPPLGIPFVLAGFMLAHVTGLFLTTGPDEATLLAERADLAAALPEARRLWEEERARRRAEREAARVKPVPESVAAPVASAAPAAPLADDALQVMELTPAVEEKPGDWLRGDGSFSLQVVGESYHQRALEEICSDLTRVGEDRIVPAVLRLEDHPHDRYAVSVVIAERKVGHLSRVDAKAFRLRVAGEGRVGPEFPCAANVRAQWNRGRSGLGYFGVQLDVCLYR